MVSDHIKLPMLEHEISINLSLKIVSKNTKVGPPLWLGLLNRCVSMVAPNRQTNKPWKSKRDVKAEVTEVWNTIHFFNQDARKL